MSITRKATTTFGLLAVAALLLPASASAIDAPEGPPLPGTEVETPSVSYDNYWCDNPELARDLLGYTVHYVPPSGARYNGDGANEIFIGTSGADFIDGKDGTDIICGGGGNDKLLGGRGNDLLYGNDGVDTLKGERNDDQLFGGAGTDFLEGNMGDDELQGGSGDDFLEGGDGDDVLNGGDDLDDCDGGSGSNPAPIDCES